MQSNAGQASRLPRSDGSPSKQFVAPWHLTSLGKRIKVKGNSDSKLSLDGSIHQQAC